MLMAGSARVIDGSTRIVTASPLQRTVRMKRFWLLALLAVSGVALADTGMLPNGATLMWYRTWLHEDNSQTANLPKQDPQSFWNSFNMAHCECSQFTANDATPTNPVTGEPFFEGLFNAELKFTAGTAPFSLPVDIWTGTQCDNDLFRAQNCIQVSSIADISSLATTGGFDQIPVKFYDLMQPQRDPVTNVRPGCQPIEGSPPIWALARTQGTQMYDYSLTKTYSIDTWAPCAPTDFTATGAESAIQLKWTPSTNKVADIAFYQALCATDSNQPAFSSPPFKARYLTSFQLCGRSDPSTVIHPVVLDDTGHGTANISCEGMGGTTTGDAGVPTVDATVALAPIDAPPDAPPDAPVDAPAMGSVDDTVFGTLDPMFVCGENPSATATSMRIEGLKNDVPYKVALLTIDKYGNARVVFFEKEITPHAVTDFWEDIHDQGSHVEGGFCLIAETYGDDNPLTNLLRSFRDNTLGQSRFGRWLTDAYYATLGKLGAYVHGHITLRIASGILLLPLVGIALLWHFITLPILLLVVVAAVWNRRRVLKIRSRVRLAQVSTVAVVLLVATHAHAQSPYWEDQTHLTPEEGSTFAEPEETNWHVGVRLGPYTPGIDDQIGVKNAAGKGPYAAMFGSSASILPMIDVDRFVWKRFGQLGVGLSIGYLGKTAHPYQENTSPTDPMRPRSAGDSNSFRLIPLVASAVYRFSYLDDEYGIPVVPYARAGLGYYVWWVTAPDGNFASVCNNGGMPPCTQNKAAGASLGFVGSLGLSIRAERIDASAARSMHESGIDHAGFYGEVSYGKVDGFGSQSKLSVGDTTWFAGVEFEF
jgi:hypothetical protein